MDLKVARQNSGLTQEDCAHLLGVCDATVAKMEGGRRTPTIKEICTLSLIYGRSFETLFSGIFSEVRENLVQRLTVMPAGSDTARLRKNRQYTLGKLASRLSEESDTL